MFCSTTWFSDGLYNFTKFKISKSMNHVKTTATSTLSWNSAHNILMQYKNCIKIVLLTDVGTRCACVPHINAIVLFYFTCVRIPHIQCNHNSLGTHLLTSTQLKILSHQTVTTQWRDNNGVYVNNCRELSIVTTLSLSSCCSLRAKWLCPVGD